MFRIFEAKSGNKITLSQIKNYIRKIGDERLLDVDYFLDKIRPVLGKETTEALLKNGTFEIEFYINNPRSAEIAQELLSALGGTNVEYQDVDGAWHTIQLIINSVTK